MYWWYCSSRAEDLDFEECSASTLHKRYSKDGSGRLHFRQKNMEEYNID